MDINFAAYFSPLLLLYKVADDRYEDTIQVVLACFAIGTADHLQCSDLRFNDTR